jgi:hypothetical protein
MSDKLDDFDDFEEDIEDSGSDEIDFDAPIAFGVGGGDEEEEKPKKSSSDKIEISIDSVESLISNLTYSAKELENAVDKVQKNRELSKILDLLNKIELHDYSDLYANIEKKIDIQKIENQISKKINTTINANLSKVAFSKLEAASKKYEKYGEIFESEEVLDTFDRINDLESFMKNFKFKSIVTSVIITSIISFTAAFLFVGAYYSYSNSAELQEKKSTDSNLDLFMQDISYELAGDDEVNQLAISKNERITVFELKDGTIVIEYNKK